VTRQADQVERDLPHACACDAIGGRTCAQKVPSHSRSVGALLASVVRSSELRACPSPSLQQRSSGGSMTHWIHEEGSAAANS